NDARALELLKQSDAAMNQLKTVRATQALNDGANAVVMTRYEYQAPDRLHYEIENEGESIAILGTQYFRENGAWSTRARAEPFKFPDFNYAAFPAAVKMGRAEKIDDTATQIVRFASAQGDAQYAVWIDDAKRVRQFTMVAPAHYMLQNYFDFDAPIKIDAPIAPGISSAPSTVTKSSRLPGLITGDLQADAAIAVLIVAVGLGLRAAEKNRARKSRVIWLMVALALIGAALFLYADAINAAQYQYSNAPIDEARAAMGKSVYEENCAACHGARGRGDGALAPTLRQTPADLAQHAFHHDEIYLATIIQRGTGAMPAFRAKLSDEEITNVIQYIRLLARQAR
ncbi:MAG: cytochrome c, partial [Chloroflexi bacterium]|nr:cytochrome c [Chloroflexota bacterium]